MQPCQSRLNLVDLLQWRARHQPEQLAYTFLLNGETEAGSVTYAELDRQARVIGGYLQNQGASGQPVLLAHPPGLALIAGFLGCLYAGAIAVPTFPPRTRRQKPDQRFRSVATDSRATLILTTSANRPNAAQVRALGADQAALRWSTTDDLPDDFATTWRAPHIAPETLALLQYTSGSTSTPKGVMIGHGNLIHNASMIYSGLANTPENRLVNWVPPYHDMGLMGGIIQPLYAGFPAILMAPLDFLRQPVRWLRAMSHYRATASSGPNFAYDLCVSQIALHERVNLDLSSWQAAFNGAEPIRADTLERFTAAFAPCGFRRSTFYPCYGLAESTLIVSGAPLQSPQANASALADPAPRSLVSSGRPLGGQTVHIVDPDRLTTCPPGQTGEIWISGASVAHGYWNRPSDTQEVFHAQRLDGDDGPFLRTGDLGLMQAGELYVTGRLNDLIIIHGRNYYPHDIELTAGQQHPALQPGAGAAFTIERDGQNLLIVAQEMKRTARHLPEIDALIQMIRQAVAEEYQLSVHAVVLLKPGGIPKTTSGKIQRQRCRAQYMAGDLPVVRQHVLERPAPFKSPGITMSLLYFSSDEADDSEDKYRLLIEGAKFADQHGFEAIWLPERHFHPFGGLYPNPSALAAALAMMTERVRLRAGSVVLPLHDPIRVAEEWAVVDNLSNGRVDLSLAQGWNPNDFVLAPDRFADNTAALQRGLKTLQQLWQGQTITRANGLGQDQAVRIYPLPRQPHLTLWLTCTQREERFREAGAQGLNVLTALLFQTVDELAAKIAIYRQARADHGHDPDAGHVTCMMHTFIGPDIDLVRQQVREPFLRYLKSSVNLWRQQSEPLDTLSGAEQKTLLEFAFERYFQTSALFGTPASCLPMVRQLQGAGVNEVACLIDFGVDRDIVLQNLTALNQLRQAASHPQPVPGRVDPPPAIQASTSDHRLPPQSDLTAYVQSQVANVLHMAPDQVNLYEPMVNMGFDSLMATRFLGRVQAELGIEIPVQQLFEGMRLIDLIEQLDGLAAPHSGADAALSPAPEPSDDRLGPHVPWSPATYRVDQFPEYRNLEQMLEELPAHAPYFQLHDPSRLNFSSYNYLGLSGDPAVSRATQAAIEQYGTSVSASRLISGEIPLHRELERELADFIGVENCLVYIGGHATNVTTIGHLLGPTDLILHDALIHNSVIQGIVMSGAASQTFPHNDWAALEHILMAQRRQYRRVLIVIEGVYSMDGDIPHLPSLIEIKQRYGALLMIDEAHSIGTIGQSGRGIGEYWHIDPMAVDIWMGTLSKAFASCGGYIAGSRALIQYLKYTAPGFVYSVGISPPNTASALAALRLLKAEPERVQRLRERAALFLQLARARHLDTGSSHHSPIVPVIVGGRERCLHLSQVLDQHGIRVFPIIFPAVPENGARLRFFINCTHTERQIRFTIDTLSQALQASHVATR